MTAVDELTCSETSFLKDNCEDFDPDKFVDNAFINSPTSESSNNMSNTESAQSTTVFSEPSEIAREEISFDDEKDLGGNTSLNSLTESLNTTEVKPEDDEWLDIIGSGDFKKKVIKPGDGVDSRPKHGNLVTVNATFCNSDGDVIEQNENLSFTVGDKDVIHGLDLAVNLMEKGETSRILIPSRLAYGTVGRKPDVPPDCDFDCEVELLEVQNVDESELSLTQRLQIGNEKRDRGNFFYDRGDYLNALHCYERAADYLDGIQDCSENSSTELQNVLDVRIKVYNNMAAAHLKLEAYDTALKSVEFVLKIQSKNVKAHFRKGKILSAKGLIDEAIASMKIAASLEPETKVIQHELTRLINKKRNEEKSQKAMYQRMFGQDTEKPKASQSNSLIKKWTVIAGGVLAVAFGMVAYRQYHT